MSCEFDRLMGDGVSQAFFRMAQHRDFPANQVVVREGAASSHIFLLMSGLATVRGSRADGGELLLSLLFPGDFFGETGLLECSTRSAAVRTLSDCSVLQLPHSDFLELAERHTGLWRHLLRQLAGRLRQSYQRLAEMPSLQAADRVTRVLHDIAANCTGPDEQITLRLTRQDVGRLAGCSRERAGMVLADLARAGRIVLKGRSITIHAGARAPAG